MHIRGRRIVALVLGEYRASGEFLYFLENKTQNQKTGLREDLHFLTIENSVRQLA